ncbi:MAG: hypothetical protein ACM3OC_07950 [Deltaproteobacteria bacterium]
MGKRIVLIMFCLALPAACLAQDQNATQQNATRQEKNESHMMMPPSMGSGKCPYLAEKGEGEGMGMGKGMSPMGKGGGMGMCMQKCGKMMGGRAAAIVPSNKGGVIVLYGDDLYKYDSNLKLIKKVEIGNEEEGEGK